MFYVFGPEQPFGFRDEETLETMQRLLAHALPAVLCVTAIVNTTLRSLRVMCTSVNLHQDGPLSVQNVFPPRPSPPSFMVVNSKAACVRGTIECSALPTWGAKKRSSALHFLCSSERADCIPEDSDETQYGAVPAWKSRSKEEFSVTESN